MEMKEAIAQRIRELRKAAGLSQQQVADALGVDRSAYTYFENGVVDIKIDRLVHLSNILSVSLEEMLPQGRLGAVNRETAEKSTLNDKELDIDEKSLLILYRQLDTQTQTDLLKALQDQFQK